MSWVAVAVAGGTIVSGYLSSSAQSDAAGQAAGAQAGASAAQIAESHRQFDAIQQLLKPYVDAGTAGLGGQMDLLGLNGTDKQKAATDAVAASPQFGAMKAQGENSILQNASATGNLRGGNTEAALAQFSPQLLSQLINQQYTRLGGITAIGQNAAAMTGNAGMATTSAINSALEQQGAATAGGYLAQGQANANMWGGVSKGIGQFAGLGGFSKF